jgi:probable O-glycosylation ligase (exosortase A-associated)
MISPSEKLRFGSAHVLVILFFAQSSLSTLFSPHPEYASFYYQDFLKSTIITLMIASLVTDERRLRLVFAVIVASVGLEGVKQGWAQLVLNPGAQNTNEYPVFGDNNGVAIGMLMIASMLLALSQTASSRYERLFERFAMIGLVYRAVSTYSRGGFLACGALGTHYILRSRRKIAGLLAIALVLGIVVPVLPDAFWSRMSTINDAQENLEGTTVDVSIRGRLHFWAVAWEMAKARPFVGVGHNAYVASYIEYDFSFGKFPGARSVHNSWLGVLAELGFPGFILFVTLILRAFWTGLRIQRWAKTHPGLEGLAKYARAMEGALVAFCVGGTFVIFQYSELLWHMLGLSIAVDRMARERVAALERAAVPALAPASSMAIASSRKKDILIPAPEPAATRLRSPLQTPVASTLRRSE